MLIPSYWVYNVDPYFHYHKPDINKYYYELDNQRSQNDGIIRHFDYNAIITGSSMTVCFKTSEADKLFNCSSIKIPFSGGSFKEINETLERAINYTPDVKLIIRGLDMSYFLQDKDTMRSDLGEYPTYLYDSNPINDILYLLNKDVLFNHVYNMVISRQKDDFQPGITSFDDYSQFHDDDVLGLKAVLPETQDVIVPPSETQHLTDDEKNTVIENISQNVTALAYAHPEIEFYYFYPPYSIAYWLGLYSNGTIEKQLEIEALVTSMILECDNIHLYSFNTRDDVISDLNNYIDTNHYIKAVNSLILKWIHDGNGLITKENCDEYLAKEYDLLTNYNYASIFEQEDYESDLLAYALLNNDLTGAEPIKLLNNIECTTTTNNCEMQKVSDETTSDNESILICKGSSIINSNNDISLQLNSDNYVGAKININIDESHNYLAFEGQKVSDQGQPSVYVFNEDSVVVAKFVLDHASIDYDKHQYVLDLSGISGNVNILFNGGCVVQNGSPNSEYVFSNITLY